MMLSIEERIAKLEEEVQSLKLARPQRDSFSMKKPGWISQVAGSFKDDPEFDEILRLGSEERKADRLQDK